MEPKEEIKVAVLEEQMKTLGKGMESLGLKIDTLGEKIDNNYQKKDDFNKFYRDEFIPLRDGYNKLIWWIIGTLVTSLGGLILAIINYLTNKHV